MVSREASFKLQRYELEVFCGLSSFKALEVRVRGGLQAGVLQAVEIRAQGGLQAGVLQAVEVRARGLLWSDVL